MYKYNNSIHICNPLFLNYDWYKHFIVNNLLGKEQIPMLILYLRLLKMLTIDNREVIFHLCLNEVTNAYSYQVQLKTFVASLTRYCRSTG